MNCEELVHYLSEYIDQGLEENLRADAQEHLATCKNCRVVLDTTQQLIFLYRETGRQSIPAERRKVLFQSIQQAFAQKSGDSPGE